MMLSRPLTATAALAVAALALSGCVQSGRSSSEAAAGGAAPAAATECPWAADGSVTGPVRMGYQVLPSGDLVVKDRGVLEACMPEADITWTRYASGGDVVQAFGAKSLDIATVGSSPAVKALSAPLDLDVKVVWIQDVIGDAEALVARSGGASDVAGLKGASIGVPFGSTAHFSLLAALREAGLDPSTDVTVINLAPDAILGAWQGDQIDAAYIWDPTLGQIKEDGTQLVSGKDVSAKGAPTFDLTAASSAFVEANPAFMTQWTRAQDWAVGQIESSPDEAAASMAAVMGTDPASVRQQLDGTTYLRAADQEEEYFSGPLAPVMADTATFLAQEGEIDVAGEEADYAAGLDDTAITTVAGS